MPRHSLLYYTPYIRLVSILEYPFGEGTYIYWST